jgi:hypothetical protein
LGGDALMIEAPNHEPISAVSRLELDDATSRRGARYTTGTLA